jgi:hypothetical protein
MVSGLGNSQIARAEPPAPQNEAGNLRVLDTANGVTLNWADEGMHAMTAAAPATNAPRFVKLLTFEAIGTPAIRMDAIEAQPMQQMMALPVKSQQRQSLNETGAWTAADSFISDPGLPDAPAQIVREGWLNGRHYLVVGISPLFLQQGAPFFASSFTAQVSDARQIDTIAPAYDASSPNAASAFDAAAIQQPNVFAGDAWRVRVAAQGLQRISGAVLANAGVALESIPLEQVHVWHAGSEIDIEVIDVDASGTLSLADEVRFYATHPGDRWNRTDTYWLTLAPGAGRRMSTQAPAQGGLPTRMALVEGVWQQDSVYDSLLPGVDDDHWFSGRLHAGEPAIDATLHSALPFTAGSVNITVNGSSVTHAAVRITANGQPAEQSLAPLQTERDAGSTDWAYSFSLPAATGNTDMNVQVSIKGDALALEDVQWRAPAALSFHGKGAAFTGLAGNWTYQLEGLPPLAALYDVTDWQHPQRVPLDAMAQFSAGPAARKYVLAGEGTLFEPAVRKRDTADLSKPVNARAIYIAPAALHAALQPLVAHRLAMGWRATLIDTQAIYDQWSDGQTSPEAIRAFLRYARATWRIKPYAVTLVGDGNYDPLNNTGSAPPALLPPYLADVDPRMGETACEACFVQLDGEQATSDLLPDLLFGRLPVKNDAELRAVVAKIIAYETQPAGAWMLRNAFIADNTRHADGSYDSAGDFEAFTWRGMAMQPAGVGMPAVIYEPLADGTQPWQEHTADLARQKTLALLNEGAAVVNFTGHGLPGQWAYTAASANGVSHLLNTQDAALLNNGARLPMVLSMACLTGSFHLPNAGGNSIDEQLMLAANGGAIATWSSAGLGILFTYDFLQRGFYKALWKSPGTLTIGALAQASLLELFQNASCCDEPLRTHVLLGDPLTPLRITALPTRLYFPLFGRTPIH